MPRDEAILQAGRDRLRADPDDRLDHRPRPAAAGARQDAAVGGLFYYPLARTVMGGLISSSILTLLVLPYINLGVEGFACGCGPSGAARRPSPPFLRRRPKRSGPFPSGVRRQAGAAEFFLGRGKSRT